MSLAFNSLPGQTWSTAGSSYESLYTKPASHSTGIQRTQQPIMTSTSVLGIKYDGGVLLAADTLASYGSLARFDDVTRLHPAGKHCCLGAGGDLSDFQYLQHVVDQKLLSEDLGGDGPELGPREVFEWLSQVMYSKRNKMDPLWNSILVAGFEDGESFLAYVDLQGTTYTAPSIATGYGGHIAQPLLRKLIDSREGPLSRDEAEAAILQSMQVLFYRDARSINKFQIADINKEGVTISKPRSVPTNWGFAEGLRGYGAHTQ